MNKISIVVLMVVSLVSIVGCDSSVTLPTEYIPQTTTTTVSQSEQDYEARLYDETWVSPAEVNISNLHEGATAEWKIKIHNGNDAKPQYESYKVTTEVSETIAPIRIKLPLAGGDYSKVTVISDANEVLTPTAYNEETKEITFSGFIPNVTRIMTINYIAWTEFSVTYSVPNKLRDGFSMPQDEVEDWIIVSDSTPVLAPKETREITITLSMPKDATTDSDKWEFWIIVKQQGQGSIETQMATRWLVTMR